MIVLDTNVLSETLRPAPAAKVMAWLARQPSSALFTTTITRAELLYGVQLLPDGQRKDSFLSAIQGIFDHDLAGQVLSFDTPLRLPCGSRAVLISRVPIRRFSNAASIEQGSCVFLPIGDG